MSAEKTYRSAIRIGGASGALTDRVRHVKDGQDRRGRRHCWGLDGRSNDGAQGVAKTHRVQQLQMNAKQSGLFTQAASGPQFAPNFLDCFIPAIGDLKRNGIKLAVNAGGSDTEILAHIIKQECIDRGCPMNVAWIEGDDVFKKLVELSTEGKELRSLNRGKDISLKEWGFEPVAAQAYLGGLGIAEAFRNGADIVICGRVADAAPTIGAAAYVSPALSSSHLLRRRSTSLIVMQLVA